jgi:hypothetical protein
MPPLKFGQQALWNNPRKTTMIACHAVAHDSPQDRISRTRDLIHVEMDVTALVSGDQEREAEVS